MLTTPNEINRFLERHKNSLLYPAVYFGTELNTYGEHGGGEYHKDWDSAELKVLLTFPNRYVDFRGNSTVPLLYGMLNRWDKNVLAERTFVNESPAEWNLFRKYEVPFFGIESKHPAKDFDVVAVSISYLPPWLNFVLQLEASGIPARRVERENGDYPLVMIGGSASYGNFGLFYPVVDVVFIGDAEDEEDGGLKTFLQMFSEWKDCKGPEWRRYKQEFLGEAQKLFDFIFVPSLHEPVYDGAKFVEWKQLTEHEPLRRRICKDLNTAEAYRRPIVSFTDCSMGVGEIESARGCKGLCSFCGIGWKYRPYRERNKDVMVEALVENRTQGGGHTMCPIATEFAFYSQKRALIREVVEKHSRMIDPLSMRADAVASDEDFMRLLSTTGMNQLAVGVEAPSQRLRNRLMKGITEEDILKACEIAIRSGKFRKIKFFMIANIGEEMKDFDEFFGLLEKVMSLKAFYKSKIRMTCSWTPLIVESCVPIQWMEPTVKNRSFSWGDIKKRLDTFGIEFKLGKKRDFASLYVQQLMAMGDTRSAEAIVDAIKEINEPVMVTPSRAFFRSLCKWMKNHKLRWSWYIRERDLDEPFLWDIVDRGVSKEVLKKFWVKIKSGEMDTHMTVVPRGKPDETSLDGLVYSKEQESTYEYLLEFLIEDKYSCVGTKYWENVVHRAAYLSGIPISAGKVKFLSEREGRNWFSGIDYIRLKAQSEIKTFLPMNSYLNGIKILRWKQVSGAHGMWKNFTGCYDVHTDYSERELNRLKKDFDGKRECVIRYKSTRYFSGEYNQKVDVKKFYEDSQIVVEGGEVVLRCWVNEKLGIRHLLMGMFPKVTLGKQLKWRVAKTGLVIAKQGNFLEVFGGGDE